ncbi:C2 and GRAM domain-containing protein [Trichinella pseudospiralis]
MANMPGVGLEIFKAGGDWRDQKRAPSWSVKLPSLGQGRVQTLPLLFGQVERTLPDPGAGKAQTFRAEEVVFGCGGDLPPQLSCPLVPPRQALPRSLPTASTPPSPCAGRHDFFRDDPRWIRKPDPPSTDRSPRSAEDAASAPDGSFAPRMQIYPNSALPPAHTNCRHT